MSKFRWKWTAFIALGVVLAFAGSAQAAEVVDFAYLDGTTQNDADDVDYEFLEKGFQGGVKNSASTTIQIGDLIRGVIVFDQFNGVGLGDKVQWAGMFSLKVIDIVNKQDLISGVGDGDGNDTGDIIFGPDPGFFNSANTNTFLNFDTDLGTAGIQLPDGPNLGTNENVMVRMWQLNSGGDYTPGISTSGDKTVAYRNFSQGDFFWDLGFSDPDAASHNSGGTIVSTNGEGWVARADSNLDGSITGSEAGNLEFGVIGGIDPDFIIGQGRFSLSVINSGVWGVPLILQNLGTGLTSWLGAASDAQGYVLGYSNVVGGNATATSAGFMAKSDSNFTFLALPLPAAAWPGLGLLLALGAFRFRRRRDDEE